jgi:hypothetical protein
LVRGLGFLILLGSVSAGCNRLPWKLSGRSAPTPSPTAPAASERPVRPLIEAAWKETEKALAEERKAAEKERQARTPFDFEAFISKNPIPETSRFDPIGSITASSREARRFDAPGVSLSLAKGALSDGTNLPVSSLEAADARMRGAKAGGREVLPVGPILEIGPPGHGNLRLRAPAEIVLKYADPPEGADGKLTIASYDEAAGVWHPLPTTVEQATHTLRAKTDHFSIIGAILVGLAIGLPPAWGYIHWDYISSSYCLDAPSQMFSVCWRTKSEVPTGSSVTVPYKNWYGGTSTWEVPQYVISLTTHLEQARNFLLDPAHRFKVPGSKVWVYIRDLPTGRDAERNRKLTGTAFIIVDNTLSTDVLQTAAPHEFFHLCQDEYRTGDEQGWWPEASATAMESEVFPANLEWLRSFFAAPRNGLATIDEKLETQNPQNGYDQAVFAKFLIRTHGVDVIRQIYERYGAPQAFVPAYQGFLSSPITMSTQWKRYAGGIVQPDGGGFLRAEELAQLNREGLRATGPVQLTRAIPIQRFSRANTPLSAFLYRLRIPDGELSGATDGEPGFGPLVVRFQAGSEHDELHASFSNTPDPAFKPGLQRRVRTISSADAEKSFDIGTLGTAPTGRIDRAYLWLVDGTPDDIGNENEMQAIWLLPPRQLRALRERDPATGAPWRLTWEASPLAAFGGSGRPATAPPSNLSGGISAGELVVPFDGYAVYRRKDPNGAPEEVKKTQLPEARLTDAEAGGAGACYSFAVTTKLWGVEGRAESEKSKWAALRPEVQGFEVKGSLDAKKDGSFKLRAEAKEDNSGVHEIEVLVEIGGKTESKANRIMNTDERTAGKPVRPREDPFLWRPGAEWKKGTPFRVLARAWIVSKTNPCYDEQTHFKEEVIGSGVTGDSKDKDDEPEASGVPGIVGATTDPVEEKRLSKYVVYVTPNVCNFVNVAQVRDFERKELTGGRDCGGPDPTVPVIKEQLLGPFETGDEAWKAFCAQGSEKIYAPNIDPWASWYVTFRGKRYSLHFDNCRELPRVR